MAVAVLAAIGERIKASATSMRSSARGSVPAFVAGIARVTAAPPPLTVMN